MKKNTTKPTSNKLAAKNPAANMLTSDTLLSIRETLDELKGASA
jgi:hypothetical protein